MDEFVVDGDNGESVEHVPADPDSAYFMRIANWHKAPFIVGLEGTSKFGSRLQHAIRVLCGTQLEAAWLLNKRIPGKNFTPANLNLTIHRSNKKQPTSRMIDMYAQGFMINRSYFTTTDAVEISNCLYTARGKISSFVGAENRRVYAEAGRIKRSELKGMRTLDLWERLEALRKEEGDILSILRSRGDD